jgi:hypothetical protein
MRALVALLLVLGLALPARAQDWEPYHQAFVALAEGRGVEARRLLATWLAANPTHPDRAHVEQILSRLPPPTEDEREEAAPLGGPEKNTAFARVEIAFGGTLIGIAVGAELCLVANCWDSDIVFLVPALGAGAGLALGLLFTRDGITPGHASAITSGAGWGSWVAAAILVVAETDDEQPIGGVLLAGQAVGVLGGELLWRTFRPNAGQVAAANSLGLWAGVLSAFAFGAFAEDPDPQVVAGTSLGLSVAGLAAGAYLASEIPMSRGRVLTIDALGVVGGLLGLGTVVLIAGDDTSSVDAFRAVIPGTLVGLAFGTWLTRHWDGPKHLPSVGFMPAPGGGSLVVGGTW